MNERRNEASGVVQPDFHGLVPVIHKAFAPLQKGALIWPNRLRQAAAVCNSLTYLDRGITVGDAAQKTLLKVVEAHFLVIPPPVCPCLAHSNPCLRLDKVLCSVSPAVLLCTCTLLSC